MCQAKWCTNNYRAQKKQKGFLYAQAHQDQSKKKKKKMVTSYPTKDNKVFGPHLYSQNFRRINPTRIIINLHAC